MKKYKSFLEIPVWQKSRKITLKTYELTKNFPKEERYSLLSQIRRAVVSIETNIAEGFYRNSTKDLIRFLYMARGSCGEMISLISLSDKLNYISKKDSKDLIKNLDNIAKQLNGWIRSLKKRL